MIILATTTIRIEAVPEDVDRDAYDPQPAPEVLASGIRAILSAPSGAETREGGTREIVTWHLDCDPTDLLTHHVIVVDETTDRRYSVEWAKRRYGLGLDRVEAGLLEVEGLP